MPARDLRKAMTAAEQALWEKLRRKQVRGVQFYRQKPIADFIVDFFCPKAGLVIEVDGRQHSEKDHAERDDYRDKVLDQLDLRVLRFSNADVLHRIEWVIGQISEAVKSGQRDSDPSGSPL
jgi:very-short-patch-repair endonuclease